jgi:hypothetical protein
MSNYYPELNQRILEMSDGDDEFRMELTSAIYTGLIELKSNYAEGLKEKNEVIIQQIRHKIKPTLMMFEFSSLTESLNEGKVILDTKGFGFQFELHFQKFLLQVELAISEVDRLKK